MRALALLVVLCVAIMTSCGGFAHVSSNGDTTVQGGFLSSIQGLTIQVTPGAPGHPPTITMVQTGYDGTSVANNSVGTIVPVSTLKYGFKTQQSNNHKELGLGRQSVQKEAINHPTTSTSTATGPSGGSLSTSTTSVPFPPNK